MNKSLIDSKKENKGYNLQRTKSFFLIGTFFVAPILHMNYSKIYPLLVPEATTAGALKKLAID